MIKIELERKSNGTSFIFHCDFGDNHYITPMPDRRFRKGSKCWVAPALRRNIMYMHKNFNNRAMYSEEAWEFLQSKVKEFIKPDGGDKVPSAQLLFPSWYKFKTTPLAHQMQTLNLAYKMHCYAILYDQGMGKTYTSINLATAWRMAGIIDAAVVVCPASIKLVWDDELASHCPIPYQFQALGVGKYNKADKFIETKTDFQWFSIATEALSQGQAVDYLEKFLLSRRCVLIIDESSDIANHQSIRTERCIIKGLMATRRIILSGTPLSKGLEHFYSQYKFLDENILGFDSYYTFRSHYCKMISVQVSEDKAIPKIVGYKNEGEFMAAIAPYTSRADKADALDLPEKIFQVRKIAMTAQQARMYKDMEREMYIDKSGISGIDDDEYIVKTVLEQTLRLLQITGGFYPDIENNKTVTKPIPGVNNKIRELIHLMDEISGKVIIWCLYRSEIELVAQSLKKEGIEFVEFHGGKDDIEKKYAVHSFRNSPTVKVFLATRAAAKGLTLVEASYAIYYSFGYSLIDYIQSQDRIHRIGAKWPCTYIHLICEGTLDVDVLNVLRGRKALTEMIYDLIKSAVKDHIEGEFHEVIDRIALLPD